MEVKIENLTKQYGIQKAVNDISFQVKAAGEEPARFWVGRANSKQHPGYMYYRNFMLDPDDQWARLRVEVFYKESPPMVLRFWVPPTNTKVWLDDVKLRPVQTRVINVPLNPPAIAKSWGTIHWKLSPADARYDASIVSAEDGHLLRSRLYCSDSLAPLAANTGVKSVVLRLMVYPSASEPVTLEQIKLRFVSKTN